MEDWKGAISKSFSEVIANARGYEGGDQLDPSDAIQSKNELLSNIQTEEDNNDENLDKKTPKDFLRKGVTMKDIHNIVKTSKSANFKKKEIQKLLKDGEKVLNFLICVKEDLPKVKKETKEVTATGGSSGSYETLFSGEEPNIKKVEATEATSSASSGSYETTGAWAKSLSKKDWRGKSKTQIPGGKFVQVKKKCKRFPYCNQGDIKALNIFENQSVINTIKKIVDKYGIHEDIIKDIILNEMNKLD
jgi:hypothetical protein